MKTDTASAPRLDSLDVFRGLTMALMILVNTAGDGAHVYPQLKHVPWHGWTLTDCVFPSFVWIIGVAAGLVLPRKLASGQTRARLLVQAARRAAILFCLGLLLYLYPHFHWESFRALGVLQRLAICYFATALAVLWLGWRALLGLAAALLAGYWILMVGYGDLTLEGNLAHAVDRAVLGSHNYANTKTWDPEGILSTIPAIASCLLGAAAAPHLRPQVLIPAGIFATALGLFADQWFPINKMLWSPSFVLLVAGLDAIGLGVLLWLVDEQGWKSWCSPFRWLGVNAITMYLASELLEMTLQALGWKVPLYQAVFAPLASPVNASLLYALAYTLLHVALAWALWRRRIFIRI